MAIFVLYIGKCKFYFLFGADRSEIYLFVRNNITPLTFILYIKWKANRPFENLLASVFLLYTVHSFHCTKFHSRKLNNQYTTTTEHIKKKRKSSPKRIQLIKFSFSCLLVFTIFSTSYYRVHETTTAEPLHTANRKKAREREWGERTSWIESEKYKRTIFQLCGSARFQYLRKKEKEKNTHISALVV